MKKLFAVIAVAGVLVACGNDAEGTTEVDTTVTTVDTATLMSDTTMAPMGTDTSGAAVDTTGGVQ